MDIFWNIFTMHGPMNVKFPNNTSKWEMEFNSEFKELKSNELGGVCRHQPRPHLIFGTGVLHLIQIDHQPNATIFQFIILMLVYSSTCFGRLPVHHQELIDCSGSLWFYLRIVVKVVLCSWSGRPA
jgi:hypothetical protein